MKLRTAMVMVIVSTFLVLWWSLDDHRAGRPVEDRSGTVGEDPRLPEAARSLQRVPIQDPDLGEVPAPRREPIQGPSPEQVLVTGYVRDVETGLGLRGVCVRLRLAGQEWDLVSRTKGALATRLPAAAVGSAVEVLPPWTLASPAEWTPAEQPGQHHLAVRVLCPFATLSGTVQLNDGTPVPWVNLRALGGPAHDVSDHRGGFVLVLPWVDRREPVQVGLAIRERSGESTYRLSDPERRYPSNSRGAVVLVEKKGLAGLEFKILSQGEALAPGSMVRYAIHKSGSGLAPDRGPRTLHRADVDPDGRVRIRRAVGETGRIQFFAVGGAATGRSACIQYRVPQSLVVVDIKADWSREFRVEDTQGRPVAKAIVDALTVVQGQGQKVDWLGPAIHSSHAVAMKPGMNFPMLLGQGQSDAEGIARVICGTVAGCRIAGRAEGYRIYLGRTSPGRDPQVITLDRGGAVKVIVQRPGDLDAITRGYGLGQPRFVLVSEHRRVVPRRGMKLRDGELHFTALDDGRWELWLQGTRHFGGMSIESNFGRSLGSIAIRNGGEYRMEADLSTIRSGTIHGAVPLADAGSQVSLEVVAMGARSGAMPAGFYSARPDQNGSFRLTGIAPGRVALGVRAKAPGYESQLEGPTVVVEPGQIQEVPWTDGRVRVRIEVDQELKSASRGQPILLQGVDSKSWFLLKELDGTTGILAAGSYQVLVGSERRPVGSPVTIESSTARITLGK